MTTINMGALSSAINNKLDRDLNNLDIANTDIIVAKQDPSAANNYTWYRLYKSGWVEQGGTATGSSSTYVTINLPVLMANTKYFISGHPLEGASNSAASVVAKPLNTRTTTTIQFITCYQGTFWNGTFVWEVKGIAA